MRDLDGKVALITGSGRGIGRAIAVEFAKRGASVVINYAHSADDANELKEELDTLNCPSVVIKADLSKFNQIETLVKKTCGKLGGLDILVNNAGVEKNVPFAEVEEKDFDLVIGVDLKAVFFTTQACVRLWMKNKKPGNVINISSVHEQLPFPGYAAYCAAKGGIGMLTKTLAVELGPHNIRVNGIAPGAIATEINAALLKNKAHVKKLSARIPIGRMGKPEEVAKIAAFLAGPDSSYVTGSTYYVDGGLMWNYKE